MFPARILWQRPGTPAAGFALLEALVGIAILGILTVALTSLATLGTRSSLDSERRTVALGLATQKIEEIRGLSYDSVALTTSTPPGNLLPTETLARNTQAYRVTIAIATVDDPLTGTINADYKQATVTVGYTVPGGAVRDVTLSTYVTRPVSVAGAPSSPTPVSSPPPPETATCLSATSYQLAAGDYNKDGNLDLAFNLGIMAGDGTGRFTDEPHHNHPGASAVASGRVIGGDTIEDLLYMSTSEGGLSALDAWTGDSQQVSAVGTGYPFWLEVGNFDAEVDFIDEAVALGPAGYAGPHYSGDEMVATMFTYSGRRGSLYEWSGLYNFTNPLLTGSYKQIAVGDLNSDDISDVVITGYDGGTAGPDNVQIRTFVFLSPHFGAIEHHARAADFPREQYVRTNPKPLGVTLGDVDNDGDVDVLQGHNGSIGILYRNNGTRFFSPGEAIDYAAAGAGDVRLFDANRDGNLDIVYTADGSLAVELGAGDGTFTPSPGGPLSLSCGTLVYHMLPGDFNNDGWIDAALTHPIEGRIEIVINEQGTFRTR